MSAEIGRGWILPQEDRPGPESQPEEMGSPGTEQPGQRAEDRNGVVIDNDGFIRLTGRYSRFAKLAREMVPLDGVRAAILDIHGPGAAEPQVVVVSVTEHARERFRRQPGRLRHEDPASVAGKATTP